MTERTVEDRLREQYSEFLPEIRRALEELEARVRYAIMPVATALNGRHEQIVVRSRVKDCESAIGALRRRQEGKLFDPDMPEKYQLLGLPDLAGVRVLVFPSGHIKSVTTALLSVFPNWIADNVEDNGNVVAWKFHGQCFVKRAITCEYQVVPMLVGLFWDVEHAAIYKPDRQLMGVTREPKMREKTRAVITALTDFEAEFTGLVESSSSTR